LCIIEDDEDIVDAKGEEKVIEHESLTPPPHISLNTLKGILGCHTL
jgi:hypothetical protein